MSDRFDADLRDTDERDTDERAADERVPEWIDISVPVEPGRTPTWPGSPGITFERRLDIDRGDEVTDTTVSFSVHTGTHIDAPAHFLGGTATTDRIHPARLVGPCHVVDLRGLTEVTAESFMNALIPTDVRRLLVRTDNSERWSEGFVEDFVGLSVDAAQWVVDRNIDVIGVDYLSVQPFHGPRAVHDVLLNANVIILEGLDLRNTSARAYEMICLPLALVGCEGAPARAMIRPIPMES